MINISEIKTKIYYEIETTKSLIEQYLEAVVDAKKKNSSETNNVNATSIEMRSIAR